MEKESKIEKMGNFVSSTVNKIVNAIIVVLIIALVGVIGWFWHNYDLEKGKNEILQKENEDLEKRLEDEKRNDKSNERAEDTKNNLDAKENACPAMARICRDGRPASSIKNSCDQVCPEDEEKNVETTNQNNNQDLKKYYCEKDSDCAIKKLRNCCGEHPTCANKNANFTEENKMNEENCEKYGIADMCAFVEVDGCKCVNNKCESF